MIAKPILAAAIALCAASANADLIQTSSTTTLDTATNLEWRRLPEIIASTDVTGPSFAQVRAGTAPGGPYAGWHIASGAEVHALISGPQIGLPISTRDANGMSGDAIERFGQYLGFNIPGGFFAQIGDDIPDFPGYHPVYSARNGIIDADFDPCAGVALDGGFYSNCHEQLEGFREDVIATLYLPFGVFMNRPYVVAPPVIEPEAWAMMLGGLVLMGLGWLGRRK